MQVCRLFQINGLSHQIAYRENSPDLTHALTILQHGAYVLNRSDAPAAIKNFQPKFIIDGGANIGAASIFFSVAYKSAEKIIAVEPAEDNFEILQHNTQYYPQIECLHAGLWSHETQLMIDDSYHQPDGYMTKESSVPPPPEKSTQAVTIEKLFSDSGFDYIDILKLDIEGAEAEIFSDRSKYQRWLPYTKVVIIELHDRMNKGCSRNFFRAMSWYEYFFMLSGENLIFIREDLI